MRSLILLLIGICLFASSANAATRNLISTIPHAAISSEAPVKQKINKRPLTRKNRRSIQNNEANMPGTRWFYASTAMSLISIIFSNAGMFLPALTFISLALIFFAVGLVIFLKARKKLKRAKSS